MKMLTVDTPSFETNVSKRFLQQTNSTATSINGVPQQNSEVPIFFGDTTNKKREFPKTFNQPPKQIREFPNQIRGFPKNKSGLPKQIRDVPKQIRDVPKTFRDTTFLVENYKVNS
jgi:hypothetical protein